MATESDAIDDLEEGAEPPAKGGRKVLIISVVAALLLGGGGFAAWKVFAAKPEAGKEAAKVEKLPPRYINLDPPFVVNFEAESAVRFLQVSVGIMTRDPATEQIIKDNDPRVRNDLLMILGNQNYATVSTLEGKESLRTRCLEAVRAIVTEMQGAAPKVEALYFTSFVMQ